MAEPARRHRPLRFPDEIRQEGIRPLTEVVTDEGLDAPVVQRMQHHGGHGELRSGFVALATAGDYDGNLWIGQCPPGDGAESRLIKVFVELVELVEQEQQPPCRNGLEGANGPFMDDERAEIGNALGPLSEVDEEGHRSFRVGAQAPAGLELQIAQERRLAGTRLAECDELREPVDGELGGLELLRCRRAVEQTAIDDVEGRRAQAALCIRRRHGLMPFDGCPQAHVRLLEGRAQLGQHRTHMVVDRQV